MPDAIVTVHGVRAGSALASAVRVSVAVMLFPFAEEGVKVVLPHPLVATLEKVLKLKYGNTKITVSNGSSSAVSISKVNDNADGAPYTGISMVRSLNMIG